MRMRKKKHADERLRACEKYLYSSDYTPLTNPSVQVFGREAEVYLEIGAGKGGFAAGMVRQNPDCVYFAMERVTDCVVLAVERAKREELTDNVKFVIDTADNLTRIFAPEAVDKVFLNFSDPWSKKGYVKRRLTHRRYLAVYLNLLKDGGTLTFKTDNVGLFDFSLEEISAIGLVPEVVTRDLHASEYMQGNVITEYEEAFSSQGVKINMLRIRKPVGFKIEIPLDLQPTRVNYKYGVKEDE